MMRKRLALVAVLVLALGTVNIQQVYGAATPTLNQTITEGTLSTDILDGSGNSVADPASSLTAKAFSFECYTGGSASTGTLGSTSERQYVINPGAANDGWTLTIAATSGSTAVWSNGSEEFDFNDATDSGCTDGADASDTSGGQLTIDPSAGTLVADCDECTTANITKGSSTAFAEGSTDSVTLLTAAAGSDDNWRGYLYGSSLSQTIPAEQPAGTYSLNMTVTVTAS